jgi:hypothetical protein
MKVVKKTKAAENSDMTESCESDKCCGKMKFHHHKGKKCMMYLL